MSDYSSNNRIAKNTIALFLRMMLTMAVVLYTSRVVLQALGVVDYGIYNVVGGVVAMLSFVNSTLIGASARFITFALGKNDEVELKKTFDCIVTMHYVFSALILVLAETIGLWFVLTQLTIPETRMNAAVWVYQSAVVAAVITFISAPYNSLVVAHERMSVFAYISILEKFLQLGIVYLLFVINQDKLIVYAILFVLVQIVIRLIYTTYCKCNFKESRFKFCWDKKRLKEIFIYAGWIFNGNLAYLGYTQGLNILLNIFFGPVVNAARGLSVQVQAAIISFTNNFQLAVNPQIIKSYAQSDLERMHSLVLISSKLGYYLMLLIIIPLYLNIELVLNLWLTVVPEHTATFVRIMLVVGMISTLRNPTITAIQATGDVKKYQIWEGSILLTILPVSYVLLKFSSISADGVLLVYLAIEVITQFVRVIIVYPRIKLSRQYYFTRVLNYCLAVTIIVSVIAYWINKSLCVGNIFMLIAFVVINTIVSFAIMYCIGISRYERSFVNNVIKKIVLRCLKK